MQEAIEEICNLLKANINVVHPAESGTNTTNIKITAHGLVTGDYIKNTSRNNVVKRITKVDADNFTVDAVTGQTTSDNIEFLKIKKYYVGKVPDHALPINDLPVLMIYANGTRLVEDKLTTNKDKFEFAMTIEVVTNVYEKVKTASIGPENIILNQKKLVEIFEKRTSGTPNSDTIYGALRKNITGINYHYSLPGDAEYKFQDEDGGTVYCRAILSLNAVSKYNLR